MTPQEMTELRNKRMTAAIILPKAQYVWNPDHVTDYMKIKEVLGDRMRIKFIKPYPYSCNLYIYMLQL